MIKDIDLDVKNYIKKEIKNDSRETLFYIRTEGVEKTISVQFSGHYKELLSELINYSVYNDKFKDIIIRSAIYLIAEETIEKNSNMPIKEMIERIKSARLQIVKQIQNEGK